MLNFKKPITTRSGDQVKFYEVFKGHINGAVFIDDNWFAYTWSLPNGYCLNNIRSNNLDLINNEPYEENRD